MKGFHWGHGILVFFIFYVSFLIFTVFKTRSIDRNLVQDDYYSLDINYQERYDRIGNRNSLEKDVNIVYDKEKSCISLNFGTASLKRTGEVRMFRTAGGKSEDVSTSFELINGDIYCLESATMLPGKWIVELNWSDGKLDYFKESPVLIPDL
jgi:nitrogen fixation protein FixH